MIIVKLIGGLGNQMFQYALGRHLAYKYQTELKLDIHYLLDRRPREHMIFRDYDLPIFNIHENIATKEEIAAFTGRYMSRRKKLIFRLKKLVNEPKIKNEITPHFDSKILDAGPSSYLVGFWQSEKYFIDIEGLIRSDFTFKSNLNPKCKELAQQIESVNAVCLNIRRADYVTNPLSSKFLGFIGIDYIHRAVEIISEKVERPVFFVFSDDISWCKENIHLSYPSTIVSHEYAGDKFGYYLQLMILCKHFIIPNSTFAWWAAWLNSNPNKIVIAPKNWVRESSRYNKDIVPESWIQI